MSWSIGLHLGESVIEIAARPLTVQEAPVAKLRAFVSHASVEQTITQFLAQNNITEISKMRWVSHLSQKIIESAHGSPAAVLTTAGFENWLELSLPLKNSHVVLNPERASLLIDRELIFGVEERSNAQGHIEKIVNDSELEFLVSKLELHKIKNVAVGFLHSHLNPENEKRVAQYLRAKGFQVYLSSDQKDCEFELPRIWSAILNAYLHPYFKERVSSLYSAFEKFLTPDADCKMANYNIKDLIEDRATPMSTAFSLSDHIASRFARTTPLFYCGLEEFLFFKPGAQVTKYWRSSVGDVSISHYDRVKLKIHPLTKLGRGFFSEVTFTEERASYDPGPVVFGRGLTPTLFDLIHKRQNCSSMLGLSEKISDKGLTRLKENMHAYTRNMYEGGHVVDGALATTLLEMAANYWKSEIGQHYLPHVVVCGPMAAFIHKWIGGNLVGDDFFLPRSLLLEDQI